MTKSFAALSRPPLANRQADFAAECLAEFVRGIDEVTVDDGRLRPRHDSHTSSGDEPFSRIDQITKFADHTMKTVAEFDLIGR